MLDKETAATSKGKSKTEKWRRMNEAICEIIEDFGLVGFETLAVEVSLFVLAGIGIHSG